MSIDCMSMLRNFTVSGQKPLEMTTPDQRTLLVFGDTAWPKNAKTNYKIFSAKKANQAEQAEYYTLEAMWYLLTNVKKPHSTYVREASNNNIPAIRRPDRLKLLAFLRGKCNPDDNPSVDVDAYIEPAIRITGGDDDEESIFTPLPSQMSPPQGGKFASKLQDLDVELDGPKMSGLDRPATIHDEAVEDHNELTISEALVNSQGSQESNSMDLGPLSIKENGHGEPEQVQVQPENNVSVSELQMKMQAAHQNLPNLNLPHAKIISQTSPIYDYAVEEDMNDNDFSNLAKDFGTPHTPHTPHTPGGYDDNDRHTDFQDQSTNNLTFDDFGAADPSQEHRYSPFAADNGMASPMSASVSYVPSEVTTAIAGSKRFKTNNGSAVPGILEQTEQFLKQKQHEEKKKNKKLEKERKKKEKEKNEKKRREKEEEQRRMEQPLFVRGINMIGQKRVTSMTM